MLRARVVPVALGFVLVAVCMPGCGGGGLARVTGTVTYKGQPLKEGTIGFIPEQGRPAYGKIIDGQIRDVTTKASNDGVAVGPCTVQITSTAAAKGGDPYAQGKSLIPERYGDPRKSGLTANLQPGENTLKFDLKD